MPVLVLLHSGDEAVEGGEEEVGGEEAEGDQHHQHHRGRHSTLVLSQVILGSKVGFSVYKLIFPPYR